MTAIIVNGFHKFHLANAAECTQSKDLLSGFITGAYPTPAINKWLGHLGGSSYLAKLAGRAAEIRSELVQPCFFAECLEVLARSARRHATGTADFLEVAAMRVFGHQAARVLRASDLSTVKILHYRAGFGGVSLEAAKKSGLHLLCDHSIAHPTLVDYLAKNGGRFPDSTAVIAPPSPFWRYILADIEAADTVLVNSEFVKETFLRAGYPQERLRVIYQGLDDEFLQWISPKVVTQTWEQLSEGPLRLLFAGTFNERKGAQVIIDSLRKLDGVDWRFTVAGVVEDPVRQLNIDFFTDQRVNVTGWVDRRKLAELMAKAHMFLFPSNAEGSARVVFEAMGAGCYIITTPNSGSVVKDGVHGRLIEPGSPELVLRAIKEAVSDRHHLATVARYNCETVRAHYRQPNYGADLVQLYSELLKSWVP